MIPCQKILKIADQQTHYVDDTGFFGHRYQSVDDCSTSGLGGGLEIVNRLKRLIVSSNRKGE
jgi:hypothetical protein